MPNKKEGFAKCCTTDKITGATVIQGWGLMNEVRTFIVNQ